MLAVQSTCEPIEPDSMWIPLNLYCNVVCINLGQAWSQADWPEALAGGPWVGSESLLKYVTFSQESPVLLLFCLQVSSKNISCQVCHFKDIKLALCKKWKSLTINLRHDTCIFKYLCISRSVCVRFLSFSIRYFLILYLLRYYILFYL